MCYTCLTCLFTGGQRTCENFKADKNETETLNSINRNYVKALQCHRVSVTKHFNKSQHSYHKCHNTSSSVTQWFDKPDSLRHFSVGYASILIPQCTSYCICCDLFCNHTVERMEVIAAELQAG